MALAALAQRADVPGRGSRGRCAIRFDRLCEDRLILRAVSTHADHPAIGSVLPFLGSLQNDVVAEFVEAPTRAGRARRPDVFDKVSLDAADEIEALIDQFDAELGPPLRDSFETWRATRI